MPITHGSAQTNGIRMHSAEEGAGPLVILLHGFPELWPAWHHQFGPLAAAGYRAVAPDLRGYGQTDRPEPLEAYDIFQLAGDIVGLVQAFGESTALIVGHDWSAWIAAHLALLRPDLFRGLLLLSVPYVPRRALNQTQWEQQTFPGQVFYQAGLRSPMAGQYLMSDVRASLLRGLYSLSGEAGREERFRPARAPGPPSGAPSARRPSWITEEDLDYLTGEFQRTGFTGGLNYYRNMDRNSALTPFLGGAGIHQTALFVAGELDPVLDFLQPEFAALGQNMPNLTKKVLLPVTGHWTQQERLDEVNGLLLEFLAGL